MVEGWAELMWYSSGLLFSVYKKCSLNVGATSRREDLVPFAARRRSYNVIKKHNLRVSLSMLQLIKGTVKLVLPGGEVCLKVAHPGFHL